MRSSSPRVAFQAWSCEWSVPESTRMYVRRPTNGSAAVLKARTRSGPLGSGGTATGSLDLGSCAVTGPSSAGEGK